MKKFKGFTLIELIVVIAIIGVLCAILVPSMMGWVTKSRVNSANSNAKSIFNSAASCITSFETQGLKEDGTEGTITKGAVVNSPTLPLGDADVSLGAEVSKMEDTSSKKAKWAFKISEKGYVSAAVYSSNGDGYTGAFPNNVGEKKKVTFAGDDTQLAIAASLDGEWVED